MEKLVYALALRRIRDTTATFAREGNFSSYENAGVRVRVSDHAV